MASVKIKGVRNLEIKVKKKFLEISKDKKTITEIAEFSIDRIKAFARRGKPLRNGKARTFPSLSDATPNIRKYIARYNATHPTYGQNGKKKNVTITGQLVEHVVFKIKRNVIDIFVKGRRRKYRGKKGQVLKNRDGSAQESNSADVYENLLELNRNYKFLGMDEKGEKRIKQIILRNLRRLLK